MDIGSRVKELRRSKKIKIKELLAVLEISRSHYFKKEKNIHPFYPKEIAKLIDFYGVDGNYFFDKKVS